MFKTRPTDTMGAVDRSAARYGLPEREGAVLDLLEDPIEFAQNTHRVLYSSSDFQDLLCADAPKRIQELKRDMYDALATAIERQEWAIAREIHLIADTVMSNAMEEAMEYGIAYGVVLEQLRRGLLEVMRLHYADHTNLIDSMADDVKEARELLDGTRKPRVVGPTKPEAA